MERSSQGGMNIGILWQAPLPGIIVFDDERLTGLCRTAHGPFSERMPSSHVILAQVVADDDAQLLTRLIVQTQLTACGIQQQGGAFHDGLQQGRQF